MSDRRVEVFTTSTARYVGRPVLIGIGGLPRAPGCDLQLNLKEAHELGRQLQRRGFPPKPSPVPPNRTYRGRNYRLCTAIDLTKLSMSSDELIEAGADERQVNHVCRAINDMLNVLRSLNPKDPK